MQIRAAFSVSLCDVSSRPVAFPNPLGFPDGEAVAAGDGEGLDENASRRCVLSELSVRSHRSYQREAWEPYKATYYTLCRTVHTNAPL